jgi:hypothetical protein
MNIFTIRDNLINTIKGKEALMVVYQKKAIKAEDNANMAAAFATTEFLSINIQELKAILADVEVVADKTTTEIYRNG